MDNGQTPVQHNVIGEVRDPFCSPRITKGLVEFYVRPTKIGAFVPGKVAELIDQDGHSHTVTVRAIGHITPDTASNKWRPGDFLIRIEGITMDQALHMRQIKQAQ
ncbi:MAG: hypothetical protein JO125_08650 [Chloroflexi bacterium]|nr:hypothetical protein [Ktedonobacteraceae bacterium]MBV9707460.1 hypothetical protein [Chloroflexota bacterium]